MSRKVFEYFFEPEDLEPFYSELPRSNLTASNQSESSDLSLVEPAADSTDIGCATANQTKDSSAGDDNGRTLEDAAAESLWTSTETSRQAEQPSDREATRDSLSENPRKEPPDQSGDLRRTRVRRLISVHALGQYVFCERSAILSAESGDQRDIDEPLRRFTYLPNFDLERIEEKLSAKITQLGFFILYGVCLGVLMKMGLSEQNRWVFYPSLVGFLGLAFWSLDVFVCIVDLVIRRRAAIKAEASEPEPQITKTARVHWWSMLKAGFEPIEYQRPIQHPEYPLEGSPWRVLQRDSRRIPVIKSGVRELGPKPGELYAKHQVRLVAYALLLESVSHVDVPYGLVFPVDSPHGLAFPVTQQLRDRCGRLLNEFERKLIESQQENTQPGLPENHNRCSRCDYGKPTKTTVKEIENADRAGEQLVVLQHFSGDLYRCQCADRFGSAPPHKQTVEKGLRAVIR